MHQDKNLPNKPGSHVSQANKRQYSEVHSLGKCLCASSHSITYIQQNTSHHTQTASCSLSEDSVVIFRVNLHHLFLIPNFFGICVIASPVSNILTCSCTCKSLVCLVLRPSTNLNDQRIEQMTGSHHVVSNKL